MSGSLTINGQPTDDGQWALVHRIAVATGAREADLVLTGAAG